MVTWEFRLQKKGDSVWLLLESPSTEIIEGEYRLAVRCQYRQAIVTVQIDHLPTGDSETTREEHYQHTNQDGLMMAMPYRQLKAGQWHFTCEIAGLNFTATLNLDVLPAHQEKEPDLNLLQLTQTEFVVNDAWRVQLPIVLEGAGELAILLKNPQTLDVVVDIRRYLWQGGKLDLDIELPQKPAIAVLMGVISFGGQQQTFTITYPPHLLPPTLSLQDLPTLTPKLNPWSSTPVFVPELESMPDRLLELVNQTDQLDRPSTMDDELDQLLSFPPPTPHPRLPDTYEGAPHNSLSLPILDIPEGELIAGIPIPVMAYLPASADPQSIKLWLKDCQTRSLLDGPRWLVDFQNQNGTLESCTQITVPLGCLEVAFEAVAINMHNHRESYKTTTIRKVTLPHFA